MADSVSLCCGAPPMPHGTITVARDGSTTGTRSLCSTCDAPFVGAPLGTARDRIVAQRVREACAKECEERWKRLCGTKEMRDAACAQGRYHGYAIRALDLGRVLEDNEA